MGRSSDLLLEREPKLPHRADSNQGSDYIAIFYFFNFWFRRKNVKIWSHHLVGNLRFHLNQNVVNMNIQNNIMAM